jgi:hypothetical protein
MARRKKELIMPHLNDAGGNLMKKWYVEYSIRNPHTGKMERVRQYEEINDYETCRERYACAKTVIETLSNKISSGEISIVDMVEYDDLLAYGGAHYFKARRKTPRHSIEFYISKFIEHKKMEITEKTQQTYRSKFRILPLFWTTGR